MKLGMQHLKLTGSLLLVFSPLLLGRLRKLGARWSMSCQDFGGKELVSVTLRDFLRWCCHLSNLFGVLNL